MVRETGIVLAAVLDLSVGSYRRVGTVLYKTISLAKQFRVQAGEWTFSPLLFVKKDYMPFPKSKKQGPTEQESLRVLFGCHQMSVILRTISNRA